MHINREYKTAQISSVLIDKILQETSLETYFNENMLPLYNLIQIPTIVEENEVTYLKLIFNTKSCVRKIGFNCSPNGNTQKIYISQSYSVINGENVYNYIECNISETGIYEMQVENILLPDKEVGWVEDILYVDIYSVKLPISYIYRNNQISKIDFVFDYAYDVTN